MKFVAAYVYVSDVEAFSHVLNVNIPLLVSVAYNAMLLFVAVPTPKSKINVLLFGGFVFILNHVDIDNPVVVVNVEAGICGNCKYCKLDESINKEPVGTA